MNAARVAELLRALADAIDEDYADEQGSAPVVKSKPRARPFPAPLSPVSDVERARARRMLQRRGMGT